MQLPAIHNNGTSAKDLCDGYEAAHAAINGAINALAATHPNGRDYYPDGPEAFSAARDEHFERMSRLAQIEGEISILMQHTYRQ